jgi:F-type H+-transporting ATPase subunit b
MKLFLTIIGIFISSTICLIAAEAGMPQLDPTYWPSQIFWLVLIFTCLYLILSNLFIPKIKDGINDRENKIKEDLDEAQKLRDTADKKLKEYELIIENTQREVQKILNENKIKLSLEIQNKKKIFEEEIKSELKNTDAEIENFKKESIKNIAIMSEEMASELIKVVSGDSINQSSMKAAIQESSKKNLGKNI